MRCARRGRDATARLWALLALWAVVVVGFFTVSPFKLPHYGLPAFPALALLVARVWDESIEAAPDALRPRTLLVPVLVVFALAAVAAAVAWAGVAAAARRDARLASTSRRATRRARRRRPPGAAGPLRSRSSARVRAGLRRSARSAPPSRSWRRAPGLGVGVALATMVAFLPVAGDGHDDVRAHALRGTVVDALAPGATPATSSRTRARSRTAASLLLPCPAPVRVVDGLQSNLAFGATFPDARDLFWDAPRLQTRMGGPERVFLVSGVRPGAAASCAACPPERVHVLARGGGGRSALYKPAN